MDHRWECYTSVLASNGVFSKASDTQFIIIVDNDTMVYITYPKFNDAVVHQIPERYYGIHNVPKILLWYIITKYHHMIPRYLKENQTPLITSWQFFIYLFFLFSFACQLLSDACMSKHNKTTLFWKIKTIQMNDEGVQYQLCSHFH